MSTLIGVFAFVFLLVFQGFLLQTAVAITGDPAPRYGRALTTAWLAGFGVLGWVWSIGWVVSWFVSGTMATALGLLATLTITSIVFKFRLGMTVGQSLMVATLHSLLVAGASSTVWWLYNFVF